MTYFLDTVARRANLPFKTIWGDPGLLTGYLDAKTGLQRGRFSACNPCLAFGEEAQDANRKLIKHDRNAFAACSFASNQYAPIDN